MALIPLPDTRAQAQIISMVQQMRPPAVPYRSAGTTLQGLHMKLREPVHRPQGQQVESHHDEGPTDLQAFPEMRHP
jgi:hypothetical protein